MSKFIALALLALWAVCAMRCHLETFSHSGITACCETDHLPNSEPAAPTHCACSVFQSGGVASQKNASTTLAPSAAIILTAVILSAERLSDAPAAKKWTTPPPLLKSWQFFNQTVSSPRAPSFVS